MRDRVRVRVPGTERRKLVNKVIACVRKCEYERFPGVDWKERRDYIKAFREYRIRLVKEIREVTEEPIDGKY